MADSKKNDAFFQLLAEDQPSAPAVAASPFAADEIIFKDEQGNIKVLKGTSVTNLALAPATQRQPAVVPSTVTKPQVAVLPVTKGTQAHTVRQQELSQSVDAVVQAQMKAAALTPELQQRFRNITLARLKGIRSKVETRQLLSRPLESGGMGFDAAQTETVLQRLEQASLDLAALETSNRQSIPASLGVPAASDQASVADSLPRMTFSDPISEREIQKAAPPVPLPAQPVVKTPPVVQKEAPVVSPPVSRKPVAPVSQRPKIEDIKFRPKSVGPIDEIAALTIEDFRRLSPDPAQAAQRVMEKIELLEQESFGQKIQAIKAWQQSEIYRLYLELGNQSMAEKKAVNAIIAQRQPGRQPTLTEAEFEAVSDLNQRLRH